MSYQAVGVAPSLSFSSRVNSAYKALCSTVRFCVPGDQHQLSLFVAFLSQFPLAWCAMKIPGGVIRNSDIKDHSIFSIIQCKVQF